MNTLRVFVCFVLIAAAGSVTAFGQDLKLVNLACRAYVGESSPLIGGFIIKSERKMLVRASGGSLFRFGITDYCKDPSITLFSQDTGKVIAANDDWEDSSEVSGETARVGAFPLNSSRDSVILVTLPAGAYTAVITSAQQDAGIALLEVYDTNWTTSSSRGLIGLSVRGFAGNGQRVMIPAFVTGGQGRASFLIRAVGPSLHQFGVENCLPDPRLRLMVGDFISADNDDWGTSTNGRPPLSNGFMQVRGTFPLPDGSLDAATSSAIATHGGTPTSSFQQSVVIDDGSGATGIVLAEIYIY